MADTAAAGEVWEVVLEGRQESQQVLNVMHFRARGAIADVHLTLLRQVIVCILTALRPVMGANYQVVRAYGKRVSPDVGPVLEVMPEIGEAVQGAEEGDTLPSYVSLCANIHTTRGGRSGRGRMFIPGIPEAASQGSFIPIDNPFWIGVLAYIACIASSFIHQDELGEANKWDLGVMSRKIGGVKPPYLAAGFARATRITVKNALGTTRSRKVGKGS
jgi:hypothetical protein